ncbi:hypothetical protein SEUCBS140593_009728 [Sporothrix eucalyptigena]|uniref:Uncharacterized protein n=1 Tax=Sporothrix eucalyptigena TaxID=1812306 RepID=A0ABP0CYX1_9PEZI
MKFIHLLLLAVAWADAAAASRCKPRSTPSASSVSSTSSASSSSSSPSSSSHSSSHSPSSSSSSPSHSHSPSSSSQSHTSSSSPAPTSSTHHTSSSVLSSTKTTSHTSSSYSQPASACSDLSNGDFSNGYNDWYTQNVVTCSFDSITEGPAAGDHSFVMIPSQNDPASLDINQALPWCAINPVTVRIQFKYMFTSYSSGCSLSAMINQNGVWLMSLDLSGYTPNTWYTYSGPPTQVTLSSYPLFTLHMGCTSNTADQNGILVTDIKVYS